MKAYQNEEGKIVIDGEHCIVPISQNIPDGDILLTNFVFDDKTKKISGPCNIDECIVDIRGIEKIFDYPIRLSIPSAKYGRIEGREENDSCPGIILTLVSAKKLAETILKYVAFVEEVRENES